MTYRFISSSSPPPKTYNRTRRDENQATREYQLWQFAARMHERHYMERRKLWQRGLQDDLVETRRRAMVLASILPRLQSWRANSDPYRDIPLTHFATRCGSLSVFTRNIQEELTHDPPRDIPTVRQLYKSLLAGCEEVWVEDYEVSLFNGTLTLRTVPVTLVSSCGEYEEDMGSYEIEFDLDSYGKFKYLVDGPDQHFDNEPPSCHPCVSSGVLCEGEAKVAIKYAYEEGRISDLFNLIWSVLSDCPGTNVHWSFADWLNPPDENMSSCNSCDSDVYTGMDADDDYICCDRCGAISCTDCGGYCRDDGCGVSLCGSCMEVCSHCHEEFCARHRSRCASCNVPCCSECQRDCEICEGSACAECVATCEDCDRDCCGDCRPVRYSSREPLLCESCYQARQDADNDSEESAEPAEDQPTLPTHEGQHAAAQSTGDFGAILGVPDAPRQLDPVLARLLGVDT